MLWSGESWGKAALQTEKWSSPEADEEFSSECAWAVFEPPLACSKNHVTWQPSIHPCISEWASAASVRSWRRRRPPFGVDSDCQVSKCRHHVLAACAPHASLARTCSEQKRRYRLEVSVSPAPLAPRRIPRPLDAPWWPPRPPTSTGTLSCAAQATRQTYPPCCDGDFLIFFSSYPHAVLPQPSVAVWQADTLIPTHATHSARRRQLIHPRS